ncbi:MAG TPA: AAA family ATPase [Gemmatimonadales bacterium]|nr:AAA family ATPase [Gemmatimonadales bacterium]
MGQPSLFAPNGEPVRFRTKKHLALLIYIAVDAKPHRREHLAELLWPRVSMPEARHSLATALSTLRPRLGPGALETTRDQVRLAPDRVDLDLHRLDGGDVLGTEVTSPLEVAAFLDGFDISDSSEFTHWKDRQQGRLLPMIKDALVILIDRCRRTGDSRQIERLADRMLALDDLSEDAIRAKMEARAFAGDRLSALELFEAWRIKLAEELHAMPSELVEGMAVRLRRRGWERTTLANIPNVPTDQWRGRPFIGRMAEYRVLYESWEAVKRGEPGHALVLGDSGVGKTTLVERLTTAAGLQGAAISRVQCYDLEREIPYSTVSSLIVGLLERPGASATSPEALAELARTVPAVRRHFPTIPAAIESQGESARLRFTDAFHEMLTTIAEEHPVILVVDDLHYADDVSLAVLHLIMRRSRRQSIMVLLLARTGELSQSPQGEGLRAAATVLGMHEIELVPLEEKDSLELLTSLLPPDEPQPAVTVQRALLLAGAGYPMVIELMVQDWRNNGEHALALSVNAMTETLGVGKSPVAPYKRLLEQITRSLDSSTRSVLNLAAILGHRLNDLNIYAVVDLTAGQTMSGMAELVRRRILRDGTNGLEFVNEMVRAAVYIGVPVTLRKVLHSKLAERFVEQHERGDDALSLEIAWHYTRAGRSAKATPHLLRGARDAIRSGSPYGAERGLSTALPAMKDSHKSEARILLAEALQEQSSWQKSLEVLDSLGEGIGSSAGDLAFVLRTKARRRSGIIDLSELDNLPQQLLSFVDSKADVSSRIRAAVEAASILNTSYSQSTVAPQLLLALSSISSEGLKPEDRVHVLLANAMLHYCMSDLVSSFNCIREATMILESDKIANTDLAMFHNGMGAILSKRGEYHDAISAYVQAHLTASRVGNEAVALQVSGNLALNLIRIGQYEKAVEWADRVRENSVTTLPAPYYLPAAVACILGTAMLGKHLRALALIHEHNEKFNSHGSQAISQAWALMAADSYAMLGEREQAEEQGWKATSGANANIHGERYAGPFARWIARTSLNKGQLQDGHLRLSEMMRNLQNYDAIDKAEVVNAKTWLNAKSGGVSAQDIRESLGSLAHLPAAVTEQLRRMGMLDFAAD